MARARKFKIGGTAMLKSGGPAMTVMSYEKRKGEKKMRILCSFASEAPSGYSYAAFPPECLTRIVMNLITHEFEIHPDDMNINTIDTFKDKTNA